MSAKKESSTKMAAKLQYDLGDAVRLLIKCLHFYGLNFETREPQTRCRKTMMAILSNVIDVACMLPYVVYVTLIFDPRFNLRGSNIYWYLFKLSLFTFGFSRLVIKNQEEKFTEIHQRLKTYKVEISTYARTELQTQLATAFIVVSAGVSMFVLAIYQVYFVAVCSASLIQSDSRYCSFYVWMNFSYQCVITAALTLMSLFSFTCTAFSYICCVSLRHGLQVAIHNVAKLKTAEETAEAFKHFCKIHVDTMALIDLIDSAFSKIPFLIILLQMHSATMISEIPSCTYELSGEKMFAFFSAIANVGMYFIVVVWVISACKLNQEFQGSSRLLCFILVKHREFLEPVWVKQYVLNFLIYVEFLKIKPVAITLGGCTFAEAIDNARVIPYAVDFVNLF